MTEVKPPVIIVGTGRNGSSLVLRLLDGSPDLLCYPIDFNYFKSFATETWRRKLRNNIASFLFRGYTSNILKYYYFCRWLEFENKMVSESVLPNLDQNNLEQHDTKGIMSSCLHAEPIEVVINYFREFCLHYSSFSPEARLVFKTTESSRLADYIRMFPGAQFVHVVRNPVDTYASMKRSLFFKSKHLWYEGGDALKEIVDVRWNSHVDELRREIEAGSDAHIIVRYEDIIEQPEHEIQRITDFLNVKPSPQPKMQTILGGRLLQKTYSNPSQKDAVTPIEVTSGLADKLSYTPVLEDREKDLINLLTRENQKYLKYNTVHSIPRHRRLMLRWLYPSKWELTHIYRPFRTLLFLLRRRIWIKKKLSESTNQR